jgi:hypothetical protein
LAGELGFACLEVFIELLELSFTPLNFIRSHDR